MFCFQGTTRSEEGATAIVVAISLFMLVGFAALAVDVSHLVIVRSELKNASDAGSLAGAKYLYFTGESPDTYLGGAVNADDNTGANRIAYDTALKNFSDRTAVEVSWSGGNTGDVQRGHWSFANRQFTASDSLLLPNIVGVPTGTLDGDTTFVNAVKVVARRESTPVATFFAGIFGMQGLMQTSESVAYIGFAGGLKPGEADQPIAICEESIRVDDVYDCNVGRMINDGGSYDTSETGMWTNFSQPDPGDSGCGDPTDSRDLKDIIEPETDVCGTGNLGELRLSSLLSTINGQSQTAFDAMRETCWWNATIDTNDDGTPDTPIDSDGDGRPDLSWSITLPVIDCSTGSSTCNRVIGAVTVEVVWVSQAGSDPQFNDVPLKMDNWTCNTVTCDIETAEGRECCWDSFAGHFNLKNWDEGGQQLTQAPYAFKSIYMKPSCDVQVPAGTTGGINTGILARYPVLVDYPDLSP